MKRNVCDSVSKENRFFIFWFYDMWDVRKKKLVVVCKIYRGIVW